MNPTIASLMRLAHPLASLRSLADCDARAGQFKRDARVFLRGLAQALSIAPSQVRIVPSRTRSVRQTEMRLRAGLLAVRLAEREGLPGITVHYGHAGGVERWLSMREIATQAAACARLIRDCSVIAAAQSTEQS